MGSIYVIKSRILIEILDLGQKVRFAMEDPVKNNGPGLHGSAHFKDAPFTDPCTPQIRALQGSVHFTDLCSSLAE